MNKKLIIGVGVAATLVAAYFIFKPKKKDAFSDNEGNDPFEPVPPVEFKCKLPLLPCPNNPMKCFNPLIFTQNQCGNVLS
jgi:hypothetical protein